MLELVRYKFTVTGNAGEWVLFRLLEAVWFDSIEAPKAKEEGREPPQERPNARKYPKGQPKPKDQDNFTDPESRIMKTSKGYKQSFNARIAVLSESPLIVATKGVSSSATC